MNLAALLILVGMASVVAGTAMFSPAAAFIVGGVLVVGVGVASVEVRR